ncbi:error-prone DNA polymerase [Rhodoferax koreense]|nr:error-prone DNA polymerase [Rhodoferax koreense]
MVEPSSSPAYAELQCVTNFSFHRGASHGEELVDRAKALGYSALAITDECSVAGVVRAHVEAKKQQLKLLIGAEFRVHTRGPAGWFTLVLLACNRTGYGQLCELITAARAGQQRGAYTLHQDDWPHRLGDCVALLSPRRDLAHTATREAIVGAALWLREHFEHRWLALTQLQRMDDALWEHQLREAGRLAAVPLVATGQVQMHVRKRKRLHDVLTAVRLGRPLAECGFAFAPNAEAHLRPRAQLATLYPADCLAETLRVAALCRFSLDELRYEYPHEVVPDGETSASYLRRCTYEGSGRRFPGGMPAEVQLQVERELALIGELHYEKYFLTVYDIVRFAREKDILCQGRGSAANSAVCYCLGITEVNPAQTSTLFERFISKERNEPPDIDVDFEHQRREEVIQYLYEKYGRHRAALVAAVACYRPRSALRDVGKALGMPAEDIDRLAKHQQWWDGPEVMGERLRELGLDPASRRVQSWLDLTRQLIGFPRHLSQHSGGFVLSGEAITSTVPVVQAAMENRTTIEWDKDDIDAIGLLKVDVLALGMLTALQRTLKLKSAWEGVDFCLQDIPQDDKPTYAMICRADTVGVFQIESRAQQSMLPRLRPEKFYDLVVEVAIVRPGPIQGGMVHPYLRRRQGLEPETYAKEELRAALGRTLGVPIFQEQVMQIAMIAAGFSGGDADDLRRSMAAWRRKGGIDKFYQRIVDGMEAHGYEREFAESIFKMIEGFGEYGFPESHAASFALLVYASSWLKCHHPAFFLAALLNSQPMGFYSPSQLVQDARRHQVQVRAVDVMASDWESTLEPLSDTEHDVPAVRLGLQLVSGLPQASAARLVEARNTALFTDAEDLARRAHLDSTDMNALAAADALMSLSGHRRQQVWDASALHATPPLLAEAPVFEDFLALPEAEEGEEILHDYDTLGLTLRRHPVALLRPWLDRHRALSSARLANLPNGRLVRACGLVTTRQQPATAKGTVFVTLEDETGCVNVIVWKDVRDAQRQALLGARLMAVDGVWQRQGEVRHLLARRLIDVSRKLGTLPVASRNFR